MDFGYDNGFDLNACGTEHPDNYDKFKDEFLKLMTEKIEDLESRGIIEKS